MKTSKLFAVEWIVISITIIIVFIAQCWTLASKAKPLKQDTQEENKIKIVFFYSNIFYQPAYNFMTTGLANIIQ